MPCYALILVEVVSQIAGNFGVCQMQFKFSCIWTSTRTIPPITIVARMIRPKTVKEKSVLVKFVTVGNVLVSGRPGIQRHGGGHSAAQATPCKVPKDTVALAWAAAVAVARAILRPPGRNALKAADEVARACTVPAKPTF